MHHKLLPFCTTNYCPFAPQTTAKKKKKKRKKKKKKRKKKKKKKKKKRKKKKKKRKKEKKKKKKKKKIGQCFRCRNRIVGLVAKSFLGVGLKGIYISSVSSE